MRIMKRNRGLGTFGVAAVGVLALAGVASADDYRNVTTERSGSMVVFPKVLWKDGRDTIIRLANTGNPLAFVHCFYVDGTDASCAETDFDLILTRQQPTHWSASAGRRSFGVPEWGTDNTGLPPGLIPPVPPGFQGQLICLQVDPDGFPYPGNALKGEAVLRREDGDVTRYNATSFPAQSTDTDPSDGVVLTLNLTPDTDGEYVACPDTITLNHVTEGVVDPVAGQADPYCTKANCSVSTQLTLVPCTLDLENQKPATVKLSFTIYDEFEQPYSAFDSAKCWFNKSLASINPVFGTLPSVSAYTRINPNPKNGGVIAVAEETRNYGSATGMAAFNVHGEGNRFSRATDGDGPTVPGSNHDVDGVTDKVTIPAP